MSQPPGQPLFLARASYRQRRLRDALRLVPVAGLILFLLPLLWLRGPEGPGNATVLIYVFSVWLALVAVSFVLSRRLSPEDLLDAAPQDPP